MSSHVRELPASCLPHSPAQVVLDHMEDLNRAHEFATKVDEPGVWSELANAYLEHAQV